MKKFYLFSLVLLLCACGGEPNNSPVALFSEEQELVKVANNFNEDDFAEIAGMQCNDSSLIVSDYHSGESFTLFELNSEKYIGRFGTIGQGAGEIPSGCHGYLNHKEFVICYDFTGFIAKYNVDTLYAAIDTKPVTLMKYSIDDGDFSQVIPLSDSLFLGGGVYKSKYQFLLFNKKNEVLDYGVEIYNAKDDSYNGFHKFISNQGPFGKHPKKNVFVYAIYNSSNIDFVEVSNNQLHLVKSMRLRDPKGTPMRDGGLYRVLPDKSASIGYIDIATTEEGVYALYTDKTIIKENGLGNTFSSQTVLFFDWEGNPVKKYTLDDEAYHIAVNARLGKLYAATRDDDSGWNISTYDLF